jgi:hypothetical protein
MNPVTPLPLESWSGPFAPEVQAAGLTAVESGQVLLAEHLGFALLPAEHALLNERVSNGKAKNISFDSATGTVQGASPDEALRAPLAAMMRRFSDHATSLLGALFPPYRLHLERARTSYRPCEIAGRTSTWRKDDTRLHVDAFPSRPMGGKRILRVFSNIDPTGKPRLWRLGEPFEDMARRLFPAIRQPVPFQASILATLGITRGKRSRYDHLMLGLHDAAKASAQYQKDAPQMDIAFPAGCTWICYTDQVMHAALAGQFALEQTFYLDVSAMRAPERAPLKALERLTGQVLI